MYDLLTKPSCYVFYTKNYQSFVWTLNNRWENISTEGVKPKLISHRTAKKRSEAIRLSDPLIERTRILLAEEWDKKR